MQTGFNWRMAEEAKDLAKRKQVISFVFYTAFFRVEQSVALQGYQATGKIEGGVRRNHHIPAATPLLITSLQSKLAPIDRFRKEEQLERPEQVRMNQLLKEVLCVSPLLKLGLDPVSSRSPAASTPYQLHASAVGNLIRHRQQPVFVTVSSYCIRKHISLCNNCNYAIMQ